MLEIGGRNGVGQHSHVLAHRIGKIAQRRPHAVLAHTDTGGMGVGDKIADFRGDAAGNVTALGNGY